MKDRKFCILNSTVNEILLKLLFLWICFLMEVTYETDFSSLRSACIKSSARFKHNMYLM